MKPIILLLILSIVSVCNSQIIDDFSDNNFTENPIWNGTDSIFIINEILQLQLNATTSGKAWLSTYYTKTTDFEWRFWIRENFSPSSNNYADIFIYSDNDNLDAAEKAYFLRFGESGSNDVIEFFRKENDTIISLCRGSDTFVASSFSTHIKVCYNKTEGWEIYIDKKGNGVFSLEAETPDNHIDNMINTGYFGIRCTFSNSNTKRFYFDDIYIGEKIIDSIPPQLISCKVVGDNNIDIHFNEAINKDNASELSNYYLDNQNNNPINIIINENHDYISLEFEDKITEEVQHILYIKEIEDLSGNMAHGITHEFIYYNAKENDIVINEIMTDPEPTVGLPAKEYIELYNTTDFPINIDRWRFVISNTEHIINNATIEANEYLLLCHRDSQEQLSVYGKCYPFSTFQISNSGCYLALVDTNNYIISDLSFDNSWYRDEYKEEGGWSLEQIDPNNPCAGKPNWSSSICGAGGTPGSINSINANNPIKPKLDHINVLYDNIIEVFFDQKMNIETLQNIDNYIITETQSHPSETFVLPNNSNYVELIFDKKFEDNLVYTLNINNISNCNYIIQEDNISVKFGIPSHANYNDIIINEILFDPTSTGVDYIEIYNRSNKTVDISKLLIGSINENFPNPPDTSLKTICQESRILVPDSYLLLSTNGDIVKELYNSHSDNFININSFPSLPNDNGKVILCNKKKEIIDKMHYSDQMHYDLLIETKGVALERISSENSSLDINNWQSASYITNYGTPGYKNSVSIDYYKEISENEICIMPEIFSPNGDGYDDICSINYEFSYPGYSINIKIFNTKGIMIKDLVYNNLANISGSVYWNGCDNSNHVVEPGIYIIMTEIFDLEGFVKRIKDVVVVTH